MLHRTEQRSSNGQNAGRLKAANVSSPPFLSCSFTYILILDDFCCVPRRRPHTQGVLELKNRNEELAAALRAELYDSALGRRRLRDR